MRSGVRRLNDEDVGAANVFLDLKIKLAVGKTRRRRLSQIATKFVTNLFDQGAMRSARKDFDAAGRSHSMSDKL